jgi:ABC-type sugar transport system substrate-binding protein
MMKIKAQSFVLCVLVVALSSLTLAKSKADVRDVTGCLSKGDSASEFLLAGNDGSTWEVRSSRVALGEHVGHTVTATGVVSNAKMHNMKEDAKEAAKDSGVKKSDAEHGHMKITSVKMVSDSCQK